MNARMNTQSERLPRVLIIGAGFAGLQLARKLARKPFDVLLIDKQNYHTFQPLLYQVAAGSLEPDSVTYPVRRALRGYPNVRFQMADVTSLDTHQKKVTTSAGVLDYDYLVIATGSTNNFFQFENSSNQLLPLKSVTDALNIRSFLFQNLERAVSMQDDASRRELINIAIIGGGPAGVELAGALGEMKRYVLPKDFPQLDLDLMSITLFEAGPKLLAAMSETASEQCLGYLQDEGIEVRLNTMVTDYDNHALTLSDGSRFPTPSVIWTAGVKPNPPEGMENAENPGHRIQIDDYFRVQGCEAVFALGDVSACESEANPRGLPMLAAVAMDQANYLGKHLSDIVKGSLPEPFEFHSKGTMATVGRNRAIADLPLRTVKGPVAWFIWMFVHLRSLVGFRNKLVALVDWTWNYLSFDQPLGLIIRPYKKPTTPDKDQN